MKPPRLFRLSHLPALDQTDFLLVTLILHGTASRLRFLFKQELHHIKEVIPFHGAELGDGPDAVSDA